MPTMPHPTQKAAQRPRPSSRKSIELVIVIEVAHTIAKKSACCDWHEAPAGSSHPRIPIAPAPTAERRLSSDLALRAESADRSASNAVAGAASPDDGEASPPRCWRYPSRQHPFLTT